MENSPNHENLLTTPFQLILRAKGGFKVPKLANSRNLLVFGGFLAEDSISLMKVGENDN